MAPVSQCAQFGPEFLCRSRPTHGLRSRHQGHSTCLLKLCHPRGQRIVPGRVALFIPMRAGPLDLPHELLLFSPGQIAARHQTNQPDRKVPAGCVWLWYPFRNEPFYNFADTNGCAAGRTLEILDLTNDLAIPVFVAISADANDRNIYYGSAADTCPVAAAQARPGRTHPILVLVAAFWPGTGPRAMVSGGESGRVRLFESRLEHASDAKPAREPPRKPCPSV